MSPWYLPLVATAIIGTLLIWRSERKRPVHQPPNYEPQPSKPLIYKDSSLNQFVCNGDGLEGVGPTPQLAYYDWVNLNRLYSFA